MPTTKVHKALSQILRKNSGRDNSGQISIRHQGGRKKRYYRSIDFKRKKRGVRAEVVAIDYDPNRTADIALLHYADGDKRFIVSPAGLKIGDILDSSTNADVRFGNVLTLKALPIGTAIHNIELTPGKGAKLVRSAGAAAVVLAKEEKYVQVRLPSGEIRRIDENAIATVGQVGNIDWRTTQLRTAGRARRMGKRPEVRGVAQNPRSHPHGGGEGRSGIGMPSPKSPWGKPTLGKKTRRPFKYSDRYILSHGK